MKKLTKLGVSFLITGSLVACNSASNITETILATNYEKNTVTYQKPGAAVSLVNSQVNLDAAGVQYEIDFTINSRYSSGDMSVSVKSSDGLYIVGGDSVVKETLINGDISFPYTVTATESGRYYLYAVVSVESNGVKRSRALTLIVQVGEEGEINVSKKVNSNKVTQKRSESQEKTFGEPVGLKADEVIIQ